jgi:hypothetical protein
MMSQLQPEINSRARPSMRVYSETMLLVSLRLYDDKTTRLKRISDQITVADGSFKNNSV